MLLFWGLRLGQRQNALVSGHVVLSASTWTNEQIIHQDTMESLIHKQSLESRKIVQYGCTKRIPETLKNVIFCFFAQGVSWAKLLLG